MLGRILRISSLLTIALAIVVAVWLVDLGASLWIAIAIGLLLPLLIHALPLGVEFITGALIDRRPIARLGVIDALRVWLAESWRSFVVFNIDQPWRANFPERPIVNDAARPAVLLIPGYMCNRASWRRWVREGLPRDWNVATISLEPVYSVVEDYAEALHQAIEKLRAESGAEKVTLVCHSMGGLAARALLRAKGHDAVARVVTICTPHHGTVFARFAHGKNTRQMRRKSEYVQRLAESEEPVEFICFASQHDNLVVPRESQVLASVEVVWFDKIGHLAMTASDEVLTKLIQVVGRPRSESLASDLHKRSDRPSPSSSPLPSRPSTRPNPETS
ncbi:MAG TPA: alpha/beta fold hydrolase [Burkholderiaceae bacterium]|nr:alpha/beta fold hydrolase [Burkholderiaceae bacterium]